MRWGAVLPLALAVPCAAQQSGPDHAWSWSRAPLAAPLRQDAEVGPGSAALASLILPGAGQHRLGQRRKWVYVGLEAAAWAVHLERRSRGNDLRERYRDLAWAEGRIQGADRVDGDFTYYETLTRWARSGAFDGDPAAPGIQPESDPATYNGFVWDRARAIFFPAGQQVPVDDPAYTQALAYYRSHAYGTELLWDWSAKPAAQGELADLIERSDSRFREATAVLGAVFLNHLISAADAFVAGRSRQESPGRIEVIPGPRGRGFTVRVRIAAS